LSIRVSAKVKSFFKDRRRVIISGLLVLILALGAFLRFYQLGASGVGNQYYAATVKSMLTSWHNFFYASFEPGGSVSVDKPPMGFWVQCLSAYFLGVTGFALALPNAIAGVISIFVVYKLIRRPFGPGAGLAAALALAVMPVAISAERNNTIDGLLVFVLLLAAWAFLQSVYTGKVKWLFIGAFIVGLGFNIKMLQAFLPLPAFYAIYFFGTKTKWWKKILILTAATVFLLVISLSWAVIVDLTPASSRPYVGSSTDNTEMELIVGHNGIERITRIFSGQDGGTPNAPAAGQNVSQGNPLQGNLPQGNPPQGTRPNDGQLPPLQNGVRPGQGAGDDGSGQMGGQGGSMDFGTAGTLRLFTEPLVGEASWLLPFVLIGLFVIVAVLRKQPFDEKHIALILWAGWLLPEAIYFTYSQGLMHAYYLIMTGAPIAALFAMTGWALWQLIQKRALVGWVVALTLTAATLIFEAGVLKGTDASAPYAVGTAVVLFAAGILLILVSRKQVRLVPAALSLMLAALLVAPMLWSALTTFNASPNVALPYAGPSQQNDLPDVQQSITQQKGIPQELVDYLEANTNPDSYLLATANANQAASFILATGRPVFTFGGFLGTDNIIDAKVLAEMVANGKLRFVLSEGLEQRPEIIQWLQGHCILTGLPGFTGEYAGFGLPGVSRQSSELYDCGN
jgi:4-amino-4-deoxy-L-arabinose transferase-like glycosyltransferase